MVRELRLTCHARGQEVISEGLREGRMSERPRGATNMEALALMLL